MSFLAVPLLGLLALLVAQQAAFAEGVWLGKHDAHPTRILARLEVAQRPLAGADLNTTLAQLGLEIRRQYTLVPGLLLLDEPGAPAEVAQFKGDALEARQKRLLERIETLRASGWFAYVEPDYLRRINAEPTDAAFVDGTLWGLRNIGANGGTPGADISATNAWDITTGDTNVVVAVIDTGINYTHPDLAGQMWRNPGEIPGNGIDDDGNGYVDDVFGINAITGTGNPMDDHDHGSHCAGTIGAAANDGGPHVGVSWNVRLMALKFLSAAGSGSTSDAITCIGYAVAKRAKILSNSWGGGGFSQAMLDAILAANAEEILFVAAAGNDGRNTDVTPTYPAGYPVDNVISVAALNRFDGLASWSNFGATSVDLGAPGVDIFSTIRGTGYDTFSGTSMACPHVAGVAALLAAQFGTNITVTEIRQRLFESTVPIASLSGRTVTGGRVNAYQALTITEDGQLDVRVNFVSGLPLRAGSTSVVQIVVTDLLPVNDATVTAEIQDGDPLTVVNDGTPPDAVAGDHISSATLVVPEAGDQVVINITANAPGKTGYTGSITAPILVPPPNDNFANRIPLTGSSNRVFTTNLGASAEPGEPGHIGSTAYRSVWWTWTALTTDLVTVHTIGSSFDTTLAVYTGESVGSLVRVASDDDSGGSLTSRLTFTPTPGMAYQIAVDGFSGAVGDIVLTVFQPAPAEPVIVRQPADQFTLLGGTVTFGVQASGAPTLEYQWLFEGAPIADATDATYTVGSAMAGDAGRYAVAIQNHLGATISSEARLTLIEVANGFFDDFEPDIDAPQWSAFSGQVEANGNGGRVSGVNSLWFNGMVVRSATTRPLNVEYGGEVAFWLRFGTTPNAPWESPELPGDGIVVEYSVDGGDTFTVIGTYNTPEFFSWTRRSVALPAGAYSPATLVRWRQMNHSGDNTDHWALDDVAVTIYDTPQPVQILTQPASQTVEAGVNVTFAPVVVGTEPISYQWFKDGAPLSRATTLALVLSQITTNEAGAYSLIASNALGAVVSDDAVLTVIPIIAICAAVDDCSRPWTTGGTLPWTGQTEFTQDGEDAAQSGAITHNQDTWIETTVEGPGTLTYWWSVSSESGYDYLEFRTNGVLATRISGTVGWTLVNQRVATGTQTLRWRYMKDGSVHAGQDRGWVDQVAFLPDGPEPAIVRHPQNRTVIEGDSASFAVEAQGEQPLAYQWWRDGHPIPDATLTAYTLLDTQLTDSGSEFRCVVTNSHGAVTSQVATLTVVQGVSLCEAVDACGLPWTTGGTAPWTGQAVISHDGQDAAESGIITHNQDTWIETTIEGPGQLSFWWSVSSEANFDYLEFRLNGTLITRIAGSVAWTQVTQALAPGLHTVRWRYMKDGSVNIGQDRGWVDQVSFVPDNPAPTITSPPQNRFVGVGESATFTVGAMGSEPLHYAWLRDGQPIAAATTSTYTLANCQLADSGSEFSCVVSNDFGVALSAAATLTVALIQNLTFEAPTPISIPNSGPGTPYPSTIEVSDVAGAVLRVTATLHDMNHTWPDDLDILLVGPGGQTVMLMSDAGGSADLVNVTLTFDAMANSHLPDSTQIVSGTYWPTDFQPGDVLPPPAPPGSHGTDLGVFAGTDPNGTWSLFVVDDAGGDLGNLAGGWSLRLTVGGVTLPVLMPPHMQDGEMQLRFDTLPGHTYVVEWSETMRPGTWHTLRIVNGDGTMHTVTDSETGHNHRYYRLTRY